MARVYVPGIEVAVRAFGSGRGLASALGRSECRISRWRAIGDFPSPAVIRILVGVAQARGIDLPPHDLVMGRYVEVGG